MTTARTAPLLTVEGLTKAFGAVRALDAVSFHIAPGEMVAMIGPNGAGKSTCFNIVNGQLAADAGRVFLAGANILGLPPRAIWRRGVGRTFQIAATFASLSVIENVQVALMSQARALNGLWAPAAPFQRDAALDLLGAVGMADQAERPCGVLSYGDVKRVELAIALANTPRLLLMDEPTAGMAPQERAAMMTLTRRLAHERMIGVLFTEHAMDVVFGYADRILVLAAGALIAQGAPDAIRDDPRVRAAYFGAGAIGAAS